MTTIDHTRKTNRLWGAFETLAPLVQTAPDTSYKDGNITITPTRTWVLGGARVPVVSGDSIRGATRRALAYHLLEYYGLPPSAVKLSAAHLLLAGGGLSGMKNELFPDKVAELRHFCPMIALLGGTPKGGFLHGRLKAGAWVAQTTSTPGVMLVPGLEEVPRAEDVLFMDHVARRNFDDPKIWEPDGGSILDATANDDASGRDLFTPQPHTYEAVAPGVTFAGWAALGDYRGLTPEDDSTQRSCLRFGLEKAFRLDDDGEVVLGLRSASGYGLVRFTWDLSALESPEIYLSFLEEKRNEIVGRLQSDYFVATKKPTRGQANNQQNGGGAAATETGDSPAEGSAPDDDDVEEDAS